MKKPLHLLKTFNNLCARCTGFILLAVLLAVLPFRTVSAATAPPLGAAQGFAVLAGSTVTNTGPTFITGDLGVSPGTAVTGFPPGTVSGGSIHSADAAALAAQNDVTTAYDNLAGQGCDYDLTGQDLGGKTLPTGVYCFSTSAQLTGTVTLDAAGNPNAVWVFRIGSTLTTASGSAVQTINNAQQCNVFWQVGSSATLGTSTAFAGNILALTSITVTSAANISGRALARNGAVTLDSNSIAITVCAVPSLTVVKSVQTVFDPVNLFITPRAIPGAIMLYTMQVINSGAGMVDSNTLVVTDAIPANTVMCVSNTCSNPPVAFLCSVTPPCGLTHSYAAAVTYSNQAGGGAPYTYPPVPDADGFDANVTGVRSNPTGWLNGASGGNSATFSLQFKVRVK